MSKLWEWVKSLFTAEKIGVIWTALFTAAKSTVARMVSDPDNQKAAFDLVKHLALSGMTNDEKRDEFNAQMRSWAKAAGRSLTDAAINALRETAVVALKAEQGCCGTCSE